MDLFGGLVVIVIMIGAAALLGKFDNFYFPDVRKTSDLQEVEKVQLETAADNDSSKIEAVKRQIERDISSTTNKPVALDKSPILSEKMADNPIAPAEQKSISHAQEKQVVKINIEPSEIKSQAASEVVNVPKGVVVKVKRVRIVEHSVNIEWSSAITGKGEVGIKQLVSASIQGEIQRVKGYALQQTESMEYEITLDGEKHPQYQLVWMDVWLKGIAEIQEGINSYEQPFQFRDRAELKIVPLSM